MPRLKFALIACLLMACVALTMSCTREPGYAGLKSTWNGYDLYEDGLTKVVVPKKAAKGRPWVWRARFWGHEPQFDLAMLDRGYHVAYCDVADLLGSPDAVARWDAFYEKLTDAYGFEDRVVLEGFSRGGLIVYNWAAKNPGKVAAIYADAPVMDFKSWPGGKGKSTGNMKVWNYCLEAYNLSEEEAMVYPGNPIDNLAPLAQAGIPIIHVVGDADKVVPLDENTAIAESRYRELGGFMEVIHKPGIGHHPHSLPDPTPIVEFIEKNKH